MFKKTVIGSRSFMSKKQAKEHYREILDRYKAGQKIDNSDDHEDLVALVDCLDQVLIDGGEDPKGDREISHFEKRLNQPWSTAGFWIVRTDGTATDFSYTLGIDGVRKLKSRIQCFSDACRDVVRPDIDAFRDSKRDSNGMFVCEATGVMLLAKEAHIDHQTPYFSTIVKNFRDSKGWSKIPDGIITEATEAQPIAKFVDLAAAQEFREYHKSRFRLRIVSSKVNLKLSSKARKT